MMVRRDARTPKLSMICTDGYSTYITPTKKQKTMLFDKSTEVMRGDPLWRNHKRKKIRPKRKARLETPPLDHSNAKVRVGSCEKLSPAQKAAKTASYRAYSPTPLESS